MSSTITQTSIANRALQILGYQPIGSIQDNSRGARAINRAYQPVLLKTLRDNFWGFAIKRAVLPASATAPAFGPANYFPLPNDFLRLAPLDSDKNFNYLDWQIENAGGQQAIATNDQAPLYIRYVSSDVTESMFDASFAEALAANLAYETCEELTQSGTKLAAAEKAYEDAINMAKKTNAFEERPMRAPVDSWITKRF